MRFTLCLVILRYPWEQDYNLQVMGGYESNECGVGGICVCQEAVWPITAISGQLDGSQGRRWTANQF